jgi:hypothetical protein
MVRRAWQLECAGQNVPLGVAADGVRWGREELWYNGILARRRTVVAGGASMGSRQDYA